MDTEYHSLKFFQLFKSSNSRSLFASVDLQVVDVPRM
jgi:hypothetical protein